MLTKNHSKLIQSLKHKKFRNLHKLFVVEGIKSVKEVLKSPIQVEKLFCLEECKDEFTGSFEKYLISENELRKVSNLKTPNGVLALCKIDDKKMVFDENELILALDGVNDPGNLGTIIRLADWFGVSKIICSENTVDIYNSKVIQATMGSFTRVAVFYTDLNVFLQNYSNTVFGTFLEGDNIYQEKLPSKGIIVMGNEANGISKEIEKRVTQKITIPQFGKGTTESLNVAMATSIILSEFKRG
ncbi:putative tRNA/rRNA methyltransferase YsgA [Flavobacteriaceae bacterium UJ101]|nr:putative tRNA/rRNA methyltransferase YsgA [Flavobacteriaceae bacterium UJ101]